MVAYGKITGVVEGAPSIAGQPQIVGWACAKYVAQSIGVHLYAGGPAGSGTFVTAATANLASEAAIAQNCFVGSGAFRFAIPITPPMVSQFKSSAIYVHGISPVGTSNDLLSASGTYRFPDGAITGTIDGISPAGDGQRIAGWACTRGVAAQIAVHVYAGGPAGSGTFVTAAAANVSSEPAVAQACGLAGATALRFDIPFSAATSYQFRNKTIYVHGISPIGGSNDLLANSGAFRFPCPSSAPYWNTAPGVMFNTNAVSYCPYNYDDHLLHALPGDAFGTHVADHWHYVWYNYPYTLAQAAGLVAGKGWTDEAGCSRDGLSCSIPPGTALQPRQMVSACSSPSVSGEDYAQDHRDRDFDMQLVPLLPVGTLADGRLAVDGSLLGLANIGVPGTGYYPSLGVEAEWMYLYPRQGVPRYAFTADYVPIWRTVEGSDYFVSDVNSGTPKPLMPVVTNSDGWRADFPARGDQATVMGVPIFDCGHPEVSPSGFNFGYKTELHPIVAMTWLHHDAPAMSTVHVKAMSHAPFPSVGHSTFYEMRTTFNVPGYDPSLPLCVGSVHGDYDLLVSREWNYWLGTRLFSNQPYAYFEGSPDRNFSQDWGVVLTDEGAGKLNLWVHPQYGDDHWIAGVQDEWPLLMGAHLAVCQPARDASGAKTNSCPDNCACVPGTCAAVGAICGSIADGCGGYIWCGQCGPGGTCTATNRCQMPTIPDPGPCPSGTVSCCPGEHVCKATCDTLCQ